MDNDILACGLNEQQKTSFFDRNKAIKFSKNISHAFSTASKNCVRAADNVRIATKTIKNPSVAALKLAKHRVTNICSEMGCLVETLAFDSAWLSRDLAKDATDMVMPLLPKKALAQPQKPLEFTTAGSPQIMLTSYVQDY
ncbi:MAG TPA: hypothetical protein VJI75_03040 [Candidatus Nanoarchaeia archaeon]|nr:hypothetical protein [Candidatus Nanoarchaeia archaeon]